MTKVFIGGSRKISRLNVDVRHRLERIVQKRLPVLVGDANGVDKAVQQYLCHRNYDLVEVFCAGEKCRNNLGGWPVHEVRAIEKRKGFGFYSTKDRVMANEADVGLMIWDGKSLGTLMNMDRLIRHGKKVAVYVTPAKKFMDLKSGEDWAQFMECFDPDLRRRLDRATESERRDNRTPAQANLL